MVAHTFNSSTQETEVSEVWSNFSLIKEAFHQEVITAIRVMFNINLTGSRIA